MKRLIISFFIVLCFVGAFVSFYRGYAAYAETAPLRQLIAQLRNSPEMKKAEADLAAANQAKDSYCSSNGIVCDNGGSYKVDMVTGKTTKDSEVLYALNVTYMDALERYAPLIIPIGVLEAKVKEQSSPMWGFGLSGAILSAFGIFASWKNLKWKKADEHDNVIKLTIVELTQDEQDRRELVRLREAMDTIEARLAPQSYREPDRTVEPAVSQRIDTSGVSIIPQETFDYLEKTDAERDEDRRKQSSFDRNWDGSTPRY